MYVVGYYIVFAMRNGSTIIVNNEKIQMHVLLFYIAISN